MFDFHVHSTVSFDGHGSPEQMAQAAVQAGLREICYTDHLDYLNAPDAPNMAFDTEVYRTAYDHLTAQGLVIRHGMEFGLTPDNPAQLRQDLERYPFDFVLGSVHLVDNADVYFAPYWAGKTVDWVYHRYLEEVLACVETHEDFDVLGHLTYICKCRGNPDHRPLGYADEPALLDAILETLARKGKGLEVNTSGVDRCGDFLPGADILRRFHDLGGRIVTIGSDAHTADRVGQYVPQALAMVREIFGTVCTFERREPVFHALD